MGIMQEDVKGVYELLRQTGGHEFRQDLSVREVCVNNIFEAVVLNETVKEFCCDDHCARHHHAYVLPAVVQVVALENLIHERQAAGLASH